MALAELHHLIEKEDARRKQGRGSFHRTEREVQKMPMLFYLPLIVWIGLFEVAQDEMRVPAKVIKATPGLDNDRTR